MPPASRRRLTAASLAALALVAGLAACAGGDPAAPPGAPVVGAVELDPVVAEPGLGPDCPTLRCVTLTVVGDMLFHPGLWRPYALPAPVEGRNFDFTGLFAGQRAYLDRTDLAICDMETPLAPSGGPYTGYPIFSTPPEVAYYAKDVGYDACTTASNHTVDMGTEGLIRTLDTMDAVGLAHTGSYRTEEESGDILMLDFPGGGKMAVMLSTFSLNGLNAEFPWQVDYPIDTDEMIAKAQRARELGADLVVAAIHAGTEYADAPDLQQTQALHALADSGEFDFLYNHHTHSIQPMEFYNGTWILYGTGNNISESSSEFRENNEFLITRVQFARQADGGWTISDVAWAPAINKQNNVYAWCSVASDAPQGTCVSPAFDAESRARVAATVNAMGAAEAGAHEWLVTQE